MVEEGVVAPACTQMNPRLAFGAARGEGRVYGMSQFGLAVTELLKHILHAATLSSPEFIWPPGPRRAPCIAKICFLQISFVQQSVCLSCQPSHHLAPEVVRSIHLHMPPVVTLRCPSLHFSLLHFTSLHFTSLYFT